MKALPWVILGVVVLAGGFAAYWFGVRPKQMPRTSEPPPTAQPAPAVMSPPPPAAPAPAKKKKKKKKKSFWSTVTGALGKATKVAVGVKNLIM